MAARVCDVDDCNSPHLAKGLCRRHYLDQPERRVAARAEVARWRLSDAGKAALKRRRESPEGKDGQARNMARYLETDKGRAYTNAAWLRTVLKRAVKVGATIGNVPVDTRAILLARYGETCLVDGCDNAATNVDHVVALASGGIHDIDNFQTLCGPCNKSKGAKTIDYRPRGV
jgi:5-methylcytosine-specific restriction endonuclease McrA